MDQSSDEELANKIFKDIKIDLNIDNPKENYNKNEVIVEQKGGENIETLDTVQNENQKAKKED